MQLYAISDAFSKLEDMAEDDQSLVPFLESVELQLHEKVENIVRFQRNMEANAQAVDIEIKRLQSLKNSQERLAGRLKEYLALCMTRNGIEKIDTKIAKLSFRKSETVDVVDESAIPDEFKKVVISNQVDKSAVKAAIKDGRPVPGAVITEHQNLQIK